MRRQSAFPFRRCEQTSQMIASCARKSEITASMYVEVEDLFVGTKINNDTCAWTPNNVFSNLVVPALVASNVPERQFFEVVWQVQASLGKSRQVGHDSKS